MARPIFGLACAALLLCTLKAMCPSFVSAPRVPPALQPTAAVAEKEFEGQALELLQPVEKRTAKAIQSAALSATFALMAEPAFAAEAGSYDIREEEAKNFMVLFTFGSLFVAAGVVFVISKLYQ